MVKRTYFESNLLLTTLKLNKRVLELCHVHFLERTNHLTIYAVLYHGQLSGEISSLLI